MKHLRMAMIAILFSSCMKEQTILKSNSSTVTEAKAKSVEFVSHWIYPDSSYTLISGKKYTIWSDSFNLVGGDTAWNNGMAFRQYNAFNGTTATFSNLQLRINTVLVPATFTVNGNDINISIAPTVLLKARNKISLVANVTAPYGTYFAMFLTVFDARKTKSANNPLPTNIYDNDVRGLGARFVQVK